MKYLYIIGAFLFLASCGGGDDEDIDQEKLNAAIKEANYSPIILERGGIKLTEVYNIPQFENVKLTLETNKQRFKLGENKIEFKSKYFNLGQKTVNEKDFALPNESMGQHLGLITNRGEFSKKYSNELVANVDTGNNVYLGYLNRSYDMCLKTDSASFLIELKANENGISYNGKLTDTAYAISQPTGIYTGISKEKIIVDFVLKNISIGNNGNYAILTIDNVDFKISKWASYQMTGLTNGKHKLSVQLYNKEGKKIESIFADNCVSEIELKNINLFEE